MPRPVDDKKMWDAYRKPDTIIEEGILDRIKTKVGEIGAGYAGGSEFNKIVGSSGDLARDANKEDNDDEKVDSSGAIMQINQFGSKSWRLNGKLHRVDGPAVIGRDGSRYYYLNGYDLTSREWEAKKGENYNAKTSR